jgi:hypothetical protein
MSERMWALRWWKSQGKAKKGDWCNKPKRVLRHRPQRPGGRNGGGDSVSYFEYYCSIKEQSLLFSLIEQSRTCL